MSQENVEIVRKVWEAYSRGDFDHIRAFGDPHIVMISLEEGPLYGLDAVRKNFERWDDAWEGAETAVEEIIDGAGDRVFVMARFRAYGRASGVEVEGRLYEVYTLRKGKVLRVDEFSEREDALEAAGLAE
jgi:ketosteroid isomerase-like protein